MREYLRGIWEGQVCDQRNPEYPGTRVPGDNHFGAGAHPHGIRTDDPQEVEFRTRLERWPTHHHVHAFVPRQASFG